MFLVTLCGKEGFGGHCFPKDIQAMINFAKDIGIEPNTLEGAWQTNLIVRPEKDWELKTEYLEFYQGWMAEWLCSGLQSRVRRFDSGFSLHRQLKIMRNI